MATTKAYVLSDGEVISEKYLDRYAIKQAEGSKQIPYDRFKELYGPDGLVEPLYNPEALAQLLEVNPYHYRAVKTKARDTAGLGWTLVPKEGIESPSDQQWQAAMDFLENPNPDKTLSVINDNVMVDYEAVGDGFYEVIRDQGGTIVGLEHIPAHTMRVHVSQNKYCQIRAQQKVWFKRFGYEKEIYADTGAEADGKLTIEQRANEVIHIRNYTSRSDFYGIPDVLPALGSILADMQRAEYNISFFENHAVPAYVVTISGAELDPETEAMIKNYFQNEVKKQRNSTLVLTAKKAEGDYSETPIEFNFQPLSTDTKEASFRMFRQDNRDEILSAHGVPPYRAGIAAVGSLGGNTAAESTEIYKQSIIEPRQEMIENIVNRYILQQGLEITDWIFKLNEIDTRDKTAEVTRWQLLFGMGVYSPNDILDKLGEDLVDDPNMDQHYINGQPLATLNAPPAPAPDPGGFGAPGDPGMMGAGTEVGILLNAMKELHERLVKIATKEQSGHV